MPDETQQLEIGRQVYKSGGDYRFFGTVVAAFQKLSGKWRYVVENQQGILHIFSDKQLLRLEDEIVRRAKLDGWDYTGVYLTKNGQSALPTVTNFYEYVKDIVE